MTKQKKLVLVVIILCSLLLVVAAKFIPIGSKSGLLFDGCKPNTLTRYSILTFNSKRNYSSYQELQPLQPIDYTCNFMGDPPGVGLSINELYVW